LFIYKSNILFKYNHTQHIFKTKYFINKQKHILFLKYKFGLYKNLSILNKQFKYSINTFFNIIKNNNNNLNIIKKKKPKIFFSKKFNKLFFRSGRTILLKFLNIKKYLIQKYISKKINNLIKKPNNIILQQNHLNNILIKCNIIYTLNDANLFIKTFGILINNIIKYNPNYNINIMDTFAIISTNYFFKFLKKKKSHIIFNMKKIKLYKFRAKYFLTKKKIE